MMSRGKQAQATEGLARAHTAVVGVGAATHACVRHGDRVCFTLTLRSTNLAHTSTAKAAAAGDLAPSWLALAIVSDQLGGRPTQAPIAGDTRCSTHREGGRSHVEQTRRLVTPDWEPDQCCTV